MDNFNGRNRKKISNQGFSIIEVLLAVLLLALVATPLLQMFYSSYEMNRKSSRYLAAADLAQTKLEEISSRTWEDSEVVASGSTTTSVKGISNDTTYFSTPITTFDAPVSINASTDEFGKYPFNYTITFTPPSDLSGYYTVKVDIVVKDVKTGNVITTASTKIPNKR